MTDRRSIEQLAAWAAANPEKARLRLAKPKAEAHLIDFVEMFWHVNEQRRPFIRCRVAETICEHLEAVTDGKIQNLLVCVPPGMAKSLLVNVLWPAWELGPRNLPDTRYFTAAYAELLTIRDNRRTMKIIESDAYQELWGDRVKIDPDQRAKTNFATTAGGWKLATSVGGAATGERGDRIIVDDSLSASDGESDAKIEEALRWWTEVIPSRVTSATKSAMVVIGQRLSERDIPGYILQHEAKNWSRLILPMEYESDHPYPSETALGFKDWRTQDGELLEPTLFPREYLENVLKPKQRAHGGEYAIASQLQQRPAPRGGGMFKRETIRRVHAHEVPPGEDVRGWDLAGSTSGRAAYTVGAKLRRVRDQAGRVTYFIVDVTRARRSPGEVRQHILETARRDGRSTHQDLPQDPGQAGLAQRHDLAQLLDGYSFSISTESGSKEDRARPLAAQAEAGNLAVVSAPWTDALLAELTTFPAGEFKDQVDALSRAYARLLRQTRAAPGAAAEVVEMDEVE